MDRRHALMAFTGVLATTAFVARPALAQNLAEPNTKAHLSGADYVAKTLSLGTYSKETSVLARTQATHPRIRQFADFEIAEQTTVAQVLTKTDAPPPAPIGAAHAALLKQLGTLSGPPFDMAYVQGQIAAHHELLNVQQAFLNGLQSDLDREHIAMMARTVIQMHIVMLQDIQTQLAA